MMRRKRENMIWKSVLELTLHNSTWLILWPMSTCISFQKYHLVKCFNPSIEFYKKRKWIWHSFSKPLPRAWLAIASGYAELIFLQRELASCIFVCYVFVFLSLSLQVSNAEFILLSQTLRRITDRLMHTKTWTLTDTLLACPSFAPSVSTVLWASRWQIWINRQLQCLMTLCFTWCLAFL